MIYYLRFKVIQHFVQGFKRTNWICEASKMDFFRWKNLGAALARNTGLPTIDDHRHLTPRTRI